MSSSTLTHVQVAAICLQISENCERPPQLIFAPLWFALTDLGLTTDSTEPNPTVMKEHGATGKDSLTVEDLAHRIAWRYKKSSDPHHSDTYTFNRETLLQFAAAMAKQEKKG